jgi:cell division topological specificity factor
MASFLERLLGRKEPTSADMARERLKLVLVTDRSDLSPDKLEQMQSEIIQVIKRYLQINEAQVQIKLEHRERKTYLVADIPLQRDHTYQAVSPEAQPEAESALEDTQPTKAPGTSDS